METVEKWRPVLNWEGEYDVSDQGRVRSVERMVPRSSTPQLIRERILKAPPGNHGYPRVNLARGGKYVQRTVHSLVLETFVGPCPPRMEALHENGIRTDCRLTNLRWGTSAENKADIIRHGRNAYLNRTECPHGHPYDEVNTYHWKGRRLCKSCRSTYKRSRRRAVLKTQSSSRLA